MVKRKTKKSTKELNFPFTEDLRDRLSEDGSSSSDDLSISQSSKRRRSLSDKQNDDIESNIQYVDENEKWNSFSQPTNDQQKSSKKPALELDIGNIEASVSSLNNHITNYGLAKKDGKKAIEFINNMFSLYKTNLSNLKIAEATLQKYLSSTPSSSATTPLSSSSCQHVDIEMVTQASLTQTMTAVTPILTTSPLSYAQTAKMPPQPLCASANIQLTKQKKQTRNKPRKNEHVLIVEVSDSTTTSAKDMFKSTINAQKLKLKLTGIDSGRKGRVIVRSNDKSELEKIKKEIKEKKIDCLKTREPKEQMFRVCVTGMQLDIKDEYKKLNEMIVEQNEDLNVTKEHLTPLFCRKQRNGLYTVVFSVNKINRLQLISANKIFIGYQSKKMYDFFEPTICARCGRYGHMASECKTEESKVRCRKCGLTGHSMKECTLEEPKEQPFCSACEDSKSRTGKQIDSAHWPGNSRCHIRQRMIENAKELLTINSIENEQ